jgi:membrane protein YdbS with pleckstrin-like domain
MQEVKNIHPKRRKHKKRTVRFIAFFLFLIAYSIIEDLTAFFLHGVEFDIAMIIIVIVIATIFTAIAEVTEFLYKKEEPKIEKIIKKEEKIIKDGEKKIQTGIKKEEGVFKQKMKKV